MTPDGGSVGCDVLADSGALLGYEEVLTTTPGRLNVTVPAVITYRSYLVAEFAATPR
ncbi:hypothetical protein [Micromonospora sp. NPDC005189]|uniref:hypothetical protein n=1 Tax=unclassified Micromonospora TaxID=2617518 RepID=UPI0033AB2B09